MLRQADGRVRPLLFDGQPLLPSAVYLDTTGRLHVGRDAVRLGYAEPDRLEPNPKRHVDAASVLLGGAEVPVADMLAALLGAVAREAVATVGYLPPAVVTYPAAWGAQRQEVLIAAIARAGWPPTTGVLRTTPAQAGANATLIDIAWTPPVAAGALPGRLVATQLVAEPVAAARYFADVLRQPVPVGSAIGVFDFGGGTLDIAVVRNVRAGADGRGRFEVAASGGLDDLGGLDLDAALVEHLGTTLRAEEPAAWAALSEPVTLAQWRARRRFWDDVRGAKEMLSRASQAPVPVPGVENALQVTREELELVAGRLVRRGVAEAGEVIRAAGLAPADLAGLFLVGGSSRVPLVARLLHSELGIAPTVLEQPELPVAEGSILAADLTEEKPAEGKPAEGKPADGEPAEGKLADGKPADGEPADGKPAEGKPADGEPAEGELAEGKPAEGKPADETVAGGGPAEREPAVETLADGKPAEDTVAGAGAAEEGRGLGEGAPTATVDAVAAVVAPVPDTQPSVEPVALTRAEPALSNGSLSNGSQGNGSQGNVSQGNWVQGSGSQGSGSQGNGVQGNGVLGAPGEGAAPQYADPVDPWATGEAAHLAAGGAAYPTSGAPAETWLASADGEKGRLPAYRRKWVWVVAALTVVVLGVGGGLVVWAWPDYPALDYQPLSEPVRVKPVAPVTSGFSATALRDGTAYFAADDGEGQLGVVAADAGTGKVAWSNVEAGSATGWESFFGVPDAIVAVTAVESASSDRRVVLLDPKSGHKMWERRINSDDELLFAGDTAVLVDRTENRLVGLQIRKQGSAGWELKSPTTEYGQSTTKVVTVTAVEDLTGVAQTAGSDSRIVQIGADRSVRVIDADKGTIVAGPQPNVAQPDEDVVAYNGRLIVSESSDAHRMLAYDLDKLGEPRVLYTPPGTNDRVQTLSPCGADRICGVQKTSYDSETAQVVGIDAAKGGEVWHRSAPHVATLLPVGDAVVATQETSPGQVMLLDAAGKVTWTKPEIVVGRIDAANMLVFSKALSTSPDDPSMSGEHLGDKPVPLGSLKGVRSQTCSWDSEHLACVADEDFVLQTFTK
ncbi:Hsp70 family protein [Winogradskya humida]|uniref:Pyrroloquinoline-quinone binding quinoprotein n=1 Tax=Winogradskya humida TaxID=113566 RepID=A0ABQ4A631_9ACTN|nr:Hsp70 family protein [Actinoplanes humidus]GIE26300.1 hypothetical protein Ahu01nite_094020 [Actinoplanes humidus]